MIFEAKDVMKHKGDNIKVKDISFTLELDDEFVVWESKKFDVYATPNFEMSKLGIPFQYNDKHGLMIEEILWFGEVRNYDHYKEICKEMIGKFIKKQEEQWKEWKHID